MIPVDYTDSDGIKRRSLMPSANGVHPSEGIPISLDLDTLFEHMPVEFRRALVNELWKRGLIEACDYLKPGAAELYKAAFIAVVRNDFLNVQNLAREMCNNG